MTFDTRVSNAHYQPPENSAAPAHSADYGAADGIDLSQTGLAAMPRATLRAQSRQDILNGLDAILNDLQTGEKSAPHQKKELPPDPPVVERGPIGRAFGYAAPFLLGGLVLAQATIGLDGMAAALTRIGENIGEFATSAEGPKVIVSLAIAAAVGIGRYVGQKLAERSER